MLIADAVAETTGIYAGDFVATIVCCFLINVHERERGEQWILICLQLFCRPWVWVC